MRLRRLDLRADPGTSADWPLLTVLVDGVDVIGAAVRFLGFDPDDILGGDQPLLPATPPRRVAVYRCSCGEPGCGVAACLVTASPGMVTWADFRDVTGVYNGPVADDDAVDDDAPDEGAPLPIEDIHFAADQYHAEVSRAATDRRWETPRRRAARLVRARLIAEAEKLERLGYRPGRVTPARNDPAGLVVELRTGPDGRDGQVGVRLDWDAALDDTATAALADAVLDEPEDRWNVTFRNQWRSAGH